MSIKLMTRVYEKQVDASLQRVLLVLCDHANDFGTECYPSIDYIAWKLGVNRKTVMRSVSSLEDAGVLSIDRQHRQNNRYTIHLDALPDKPPFIRHESQNGTQEGGQGGMVESHNATQEGQNVTQEGTECHPIGSTQMGLQPSVKPSERTTSINHQRDADASASTRSPSSQTDDAFEAWWASYPRKVGKTAARRKWRTLNPSPAMVATMMDALDRQRQSPDWRKDGGRYIPHPTTWLNQGRWEDEDDIDIEPEVFDPSRVDWRIPTRPGQAILGP